MLRRPGFCRHTRKLPLTAKILDIGCGKHKWPGSVGLDIAPLEGVDVVHDLNQFPYPFPDNSFDRIRVIHVIEHIQSIPRTMEEIHRIARHGAQIDIETPHYTDASSWQDPSHVWHLNTRSFDFFLADHASNYYSKARFEVEWSYVMLLKLYKWLGIEFLVNLENKVPSCRFLRKFWEQYLCFIVRGKVMTFRLKAIKQ
jgi:SAM-dependent methyltransferase